MAAQSSPQDGIFRQVLKEFTDMLTPDEADNFRLSSLDDLRTAILEIQAKQASEKRMRDLTRLQSFLEAMEQYGNIIEIFLNTTEFVAFVWGPMKFLLQVASTYAEAFESLLQAYEQIGENIPLLAQYEAMFCKSPYMRKVLELIYVDILEFHKVALRYFKQRMWKQLFQATWKTFRTRFGGILENLRRHKSLVESQANLAHFEEFQRARTAAEAEVDRIKEEEEKRRQVAVRTWLSAASTEVDQENYAGIRAEYPGTGRWLLRQTYVRAWCNPDSSSMPLLWIKGIPGAGKTILASLVIEECRKLLDVHVVFFYCKFRDIRRNSFLAVARRMLAQLISFDKDLLAYVYEKASISGETSLDSIKLAKELLEIAFKSLGKVYILIDGLDECDKAEKKSISAYFQSIVHSVSGSDPESLRCLFIGQHDNDAGSLFAGLPTLPIDRDLNKQDIFSYCSVWADKIQEKFGLSNEVKLSMAMEISDRAGGMFLFAKLVTHNLFNQTRKANLNKELDPKRFPKDLNDAYTRIVHRVLDEAAPAESEDAALLLGWLVCAKRPLRWYEIQGGVSIDLSMQTVDFEERKLNVDLKTLCGSLVEVYADGEVDLVHLTARRFLTEQKHVFIAREEFNLACLCVGYLCLPCFDAGISEETISKFVLEGHYAFMDYAIAFWVDHLSEYVNNIDTNGSGSVKTIAGILGNLFSKHDKGLRSPSIPKAITEAFHQFREHDFFNKLVQTVTYAKVQSQAPAKQANHKDPLDLLERLADIRSVLEKMGSKSTVIQRRKLEVLYGSLLFKCPKVYCKFFYAGFPDLEEREKHFIKHQRAYYCAYPGCHIASLGCDTPVELEKHVSGFHQEIEQVSFPLSSTQDPKSIQILKEVRARNIGAVEIWLGQFEGQMNTDKIFHQSNQSPLGLAIESGDEDLVGIFLWHIPKEAVADKLKWRWDEIIRAALNARQELIVKLLLEHYDGIHEHLWYLLVTRALFLGSDKSTLQLFEAGCGFRRRRTDRQSRILIKAAECGRISIVRHIISEYKVNPAAAEDPEKRTPLTAASEFGQVETVEYLLSSGNCAPFLPALKAASNGYENVIRMLFSPGSDSLEMATCLISAQLYNAVRAGDAQLVEQLLREENIKPDLVDRQGYTPLLRSAELGHEDIFGLLLDHNVNVNRVVQDVEGRRKRGKYGKTALILATIHEHENIVLRLLSHTDIDTTFITRFRTYVSREWKNALQIATEVGNVSIARMLNDHKANKGGPAGQPKMTSELVTETTET